MPAEESLQVWRNSKHIVDLYFDWLPNHKPYTRQCDINEIPEAFAQYNSFISLTNTSLPGLDDFHVSDVNIFFLDTRVKGMIRYKFCYSLFK
jgi:hypothetical protein